jgi:hypothetical protein
MNGELKDQNKIKNYKNTKIQKQEKTEKIVVEKRTDGQINMNSCQQIKGNNFVGEVMGAIGTLNWMEWKKTKAPQWMIMGIKEGFWWEVEPGLEEKIFKNSEMTQEQIEFVDKVWEEWKCQGVLEKGKIQCICGMKVAKKKGPKKWRLCVNNRPVNKKVKRWKVKFDGIQVVKQMMIGMKWGIQFDLKNGYLHVQFHPEFRQWMGVEWKGETLRFARMPFGFTNAPGLFTLLMRETVRTLREEGMRIVLWVDDGLVLAETKEELLIWRGKLMKRLIALGWEINMEKSQWEPTQEIIFIGYQLDLKNGRVGIPTERLKGLRKVMLKAIRELEKTGTLKLRKIAKVMGVLVSVKEAWPPALAFSRAGFRTLGEMTEKKLKWSDKVIPDSQLLGDLNMVMKLLIAGGSCQVEGSLRITEVWSDASPTGWACMMNLLEARGDWNMEEKVLSTNRRELLGFWYGILALEQEVRNKVIKWIGDNTTALVWMWKGARDKTVAELVKEIWIWLNQMGVELTQPFWVKSEDMIMDALSRWIDQDDWEVQDWIFQEAEKRWGPHTVDRFANKSNKKIQKFNSLYWEVGTAGIDAFCQNWTMENNWLVPPISEIPRVLMYLKEQKGKGTILIPKWTQWWWPMIVEMTKEIWVIGQGGRGDIFQKGPSGIVEPLQNKFWEWWLVRIEL